MFRYSPRHGNGRAQVFITCVSFTNSSPITLNAGVVCLGRGVVCYLLGIYPPILTARLSSICVRVHITVYWRVPLSSPLPRNGTAKVQTYLETTKQKTKNLCLFNLLQQIKLIYAVFIHILSTNLAKCAICKANFFAFRLQYAHAHTYIYKDKYKCYLCIAFAVCLRVFVFVFWYAAPDF